jgi:hypothetical protein
LQIFQAHLAVSFPEELSILRHSLTPEAGFDAVHPLFIPFFVFREAKLFRKLRQFLPRQSRRSGGLSDYAFPISPAFQVSCF